MLELALAFPPLLVIHPNSQEFRLAIDCWNDFLDSIKHDRLPQQWRLEVRNLYKDPIQFNPTRSKVFSDGIVESTYMGGHENGNYPLVTRALINHDYLKVTSRTFHGPNVDRIRALIEENFE